MSNILRNMSKPLRALAPLLGVWLGLTGFGGCKSLWKRSVADNVIAARQTFLRGMDAMQQERWEEAEQLFSQSIATSPVDAAAQRRFAQTLWRRGDHTRAVRHMEESVRLATGDAEALVELGEMYLALGDLSRADRAAEEALRADRASAPAWALRGDLLLVQDAAEGALSHYHRALGFRPHFPRVQIQIARTYQQLNRPQRALATLEILVEHLQPEEVTEEMHLLRGLALKALGRYDDAVVALAAAAQGGHPDCLYHLGEAQWLAGDPVAAQNNVRAALQRAPQHEASRRLKSYLETHRMAALPAAY